MKLFAFCLIFVALFSSCKEKKFPKVDYANLEPTCTEQSKLFFKNVRQYYYERDDKIGATAPLFRWTKTRVNQQKPYVNLVIALNELNNQANLLIEPNDFIKASENPIIIVADTSYQTIDTISLTFSGMNDHLVKAGKIYDYIDEKSNFYFQLAKPENAMLTESSDRANYQKVVRDYLRLINAIL